MAGIRSLILAAAIVAATLSSSHAYAAPIPEWARPAVRYLHNAGHLNRKDIRPNHSMSRKSFRALMRSSFGPGYFKGAAGKVTAREVSRALVAALGKREIARELGSPATAGAWTPDTPSYFGTEILAREMQLRHDRPTSEEKFEASAREPLRQADIAWAVWKAKTDPSLYAADALSDFALPRYRGVRRKVLEYAFSLVGTPYVWAGEWPTKTPAGYPYGAQSHGGFDCSGFVWNVLRAKTSSWRPTGRPYKGWTLPERSSSGMAAGGNKRLGYKRLRPGDILFFSPDGRKGGPSSVFHAAIFLGRGWMIHSSGSRAGVSIAPLSPGSSWHAQFAWGRRVIR